jgi:hypothetical protein
MIPFTVLFCLKYGVIVLKFFNAHCALLSLFTCHFIASVIFQTNSDFDAKPMVMLLGQYSTGKTTFIKHLLKTTYPGLMLHLVKQIRVSAILAVLFSIVSDCIKI